MEPIDTNIYSSRDDDDTNSAEQDIYSKIDLKSIKLKPKPPAPAPSIFMDPRAMELSSAMKRINYFNE